MRIKSGKHGRTGRDAKRVGTIGFGITNPMACQPIHVGGLQVPGANAVTHGSRRLLVCDDDKDVRSCIRIPGG